MFKPRPQLLQHSTAPVAFTSQPWQQNLTGPSGEGGTGGGDGDKGKGDNAGDKGGTGDKSAEKQGDPADQAKLGDAGKRALDKERERAEAAEKRAKDAEAALADSKLTEQERAEKAAAKAVEDARAETAATSSKLTAAEQTIARYEAAAKAGLSLDMAKRLVGNTVEELEQDAKTFAASMPQGRTPRPDRSQGQGGGGTKSGGSVAAAKEEYLASRVKK